ncbi:hypothetical protein CONPUDRAFT_77814 [Coniophora puteana RWD-64-598 SS2]|uniref:Uncharacterized protein n=1 Tax=Coniophora puteana (strain RWD-64-598) TaxID=741705 RepID=A0A5M3M7N1_CONPW|nr:uncharacterized protein CONPUDRAFT_77814 [Coniophora puteana RWD-64-598 SS2]EIW75043.1 hypothetical protein CONPUDRAFT_77814 [Coniophora puteana RWD-64-598 SS2]
MATALGAVRGGRCPVGAIPVEILCDIFLRSAAISARVAIPNCDFRGGCRLSLNVAQVCREWRSIALSIPELWGLIYFSRRHAQTQDFSELIELLSRSNFSSSFLVCETYFSTLIERSFEKLVSLCSQGRLDSFHDRFLGVDITVWEGYGEVASWLQRFKRLQRLKIICEEGDYWIEDMPSTFPNLTHLYIKFNLSTEAERLVKTGWRGLRSLIVQMDGDLFYWDAQKLCSNFPDLEELLILTPVLRLCSTPTHDVNLTTHFALKSLVVNCIIVKPESTAFGYLGTITLPALKHLVIDISNLTPADLQPMEDFADRSQVRLNTLSLITSTATIPSDSDIDKETSRSRVLRVILNAFGVDRAEVTYAFFKTRLWFDWMANWYRPYVSHDLDRDTESFRRYITLTGIL